MYFKTVMTPSVETRHSVPQVSKSLSSVLSNQREWSITQTYVNVTFYQ